MKAIELALVILVMLAFCSAPTTAGPRSDLGAAPHGDMAWDGASAADHLIRGGMCAVRSIPDAYLQNEDLRHADG